MKVEELDIPEEAKEIIRADGIEELYPPQAEGVDDVLQGNNCVFALPTASGKSLLAYLGIIKRVVENGGKALYIVPLRALASEKIEDLKRFESLGLNLSISMGDYDRPDPSLKESDVIIATSEKADSLLRQNVGWLDKLNLVIADEVHLINDRERGATLEVTLSKLKQVNPDAQIIALSATIKNSDAIARWLDAEHHKSDWRPVELKEGVYHNNKIRFEDGDTEECNDSRAEIAICEPTLKEGKQCLVFVGTRRSTEGTSKRLRKTVNEYLTEEEKEELEEISEKILSNSTTSVGESLSEVVKDGIAFHNAGLNNEQRKMVERGFRDGFIKLIVATPTLAAGINMPARRVIVRDCRRYDAVRGFRAPLPVMEVKQMSGRAGRPGYDDVGEAVLVAKRDSDEKMLFEEYVLGDSEVIFSRMATEPALRKHILALIATSHCGTEDELYDFMEETFYAEYSDIWMIEDQVRKTIDLLEEKGMVEKGEDGDVLKPTRFGRRVSDLYIDPLSADKMRTAVDSGKMGIPLSYLQIISSTPDMFPLYIKKSELPLYEEKADAIRADLFEDLPQDPSDLEYFLSALKTASMLKDWMDELSEDEIANKYGIGPGDIRNKVETAEWLLHSASEVAKLYNKQKSEVLKNMTERIKYGIKEELLPLTKLEQIGRVRARTLYKAGYDTPEKFKNASEKELKELEGIGDTISKKGKGGRQIDQSLGDTEDHGEEQSTLSDF